MKDWRKYCKAGGKVEKIEGSRLRDWRIKKQVCRKFREVENKEEKSEDKAAKVEDRISTNWRYN